MTVDALIGVLNRVDLDADVIDDMFLDIEPEDIKQITLNGKTVVQIGK